MQMRRRFVGISIFYQQNDQACLTNDHGAGISEQQRVYEEKQTEFWTLLP